MTDKPKVSVKDIFKSRGISRKKISSIFSQMHPPASGPLRQEPAPEQKSEYYPAAVEISSSSLKLLQVTKTPQGYKIAKAAYLPLKINPQAQISELKDSLQKLTQDHQISGEVVSSLPISKIQTFTYILPSMPEGEIEQAIAWKLKQNPPAGTTFEAISFDYVPCLSPKAGISAKDMKVLVFAVAKDLILERFRFFQDLSLELIAVEPKPYAALHALFWLGKIRQEETVLVLQIGASHSSISIVNSGTPYLIRPLSVSGNTFTEAIVNYHQLDWKEAELAKRRDGVRPESNSAAALSSQLENLIVDIEHTFKYFSHQIMKSQVASFDRILLCSGGAGLNNLSTFLAERLVVPVDLFNPFTQLSLLEGKEFAPLVKENYISFASALGLATRYIDW